MLASRGHVTSFPLGNQAVSRPKVACRGGFSLQWGEAEGLAAALALVQLFRDNEDCLKG